MNKENLLNLVKRINKENILSKKEFKMKVTQVLVKDNDNRKIEGLVTSLLEGIADNIKDQDVENLLVVLNELVKNNQNEALMTQTYKISDNEKALLQNSELNMLYSESLLKIQSLESELKSKNDLQEQIHYLRIELEKFKNLDLEKILEDNKLYSEMFKITGNNLIEVPDEDIDALYVRYKTQGTKKYGKAFVAENETIPKAYYSLKEGNNCEIFK